MRWTSLMNFYSRILLLLGVHKLEIKLGYDEKLQIGFVDCVHFTSSPSHSPSVFAAEATRNKCMFVSYLGHD